MMVNKDKARALGESGRFFHSGSVTMIWPQPRAFFAGCKLKLKFKTFFCLYEMNVFDCECHIWDCYVYI